MKNVKHWGYLVISLLLVITAFTISCTRDEVTTTQLEVIEQPQIADAQQWFEQQMYSKNYLLNENGMQLYTDWRPDWKKAVVYELPDGYTVEIPIAFTEQFTLISAQLLTEYEKTKDPKYLATEVRLVIETNFSTGLKQDFIMLISPSLKYVESNNKGQNSYMNMNPYFDGMVLYYTPNWIFANGWGLSGEAVGAVTKVDNRTLTRGNAYEDCVNMFFLTAMTPDFPLTSYLGCYRNEDDDKNEEGGGGIKPEWETRPNPGEPGRKTEDPPKPPIIYIPLPEYPDNPYDPNKGNENDCFNPD